MLRKLQKTITAVGLSVTLLGLAACTDGSVLSIPRESLATVVKLKNNVMSKDEQDSAIKDLSAAQESHQTEALEEIEKR